MIGLAGIDQIIGGGAGRGLDCDDLLVERGDLWESWLICVVIEVASRGDLLCVCCRRW